jgi:steroid delta-isomerase-like uncharacterized protein
MSNDSTDSPAAANSAVVRRHYDRAWNAGDLATVDDTHAADCVHHDPSNPVPMRGRGDIKARLAAVQEAFGDFKVAVNDLIAAGDKVVVHFSVSGTHRAAFAGIPATGRTIKVDGIIIHRLSDGRIVEDVAVRDTFGLMIQLGVIPPPGGPRS